MAISKIKISKLPTTTGIYLFKQGKEILYIGKSINLRSRLISHLENARIDAKEEAIVSNSDSVHYIITDSEFKALLLESQLIQKYKPKYNARWRDDKSHLYIKITVNDKYPKISSTRKELDKKARLFGPFPSVRSVYEVLREIRRVFPYCSQGKLGKRSCFYSKIHLCEPCPNYIEQVSDVKLKKELIGEYKKNIKNIIKVLDGKTELILNNLYKELKQLAEKEQYEEAIYLRNRIQYFEQLLNRKLFSPDNLPLYNQSNESLMSLLKLLQKFITNLESLTRIECIDISNLAQKQATASLVVLTNGLIDKKEYKRFKIKNLDLSTDFEMICEVLERRLKHSWQLPNLLVIDGGKPQVRVTLKVLHDLNIKIPVIGIAKHPDRIIIGQRDLPMVKPSTHHLGFNLLRSLRDESHRFAKKYHLYLRNKSLLKSF